MGQALAVAGADHTCESYLMSRILMQRRYLMRSNTHRSELRIGKVKKLITEHLNSTRLSDFIG